MNKSNLKPTNNLKVITKKPIKNRIRKTDRIILHNGRSEVPFGFALAHMPRGYFGIHKAEDMFDKNGTLTGVSINLESTVELLEVDGCVYLPENGVLEVPKDVILLFNRSQEHDEFFTMYLHNSVTSKFNILDDDFTLVKCRIKRNIVKIYLSKPSDVAKKPAPGTVKFFHDVILFPDDITERLQKFVNSARAQSGLVPIRGDKDD